MTHSSTPPPSNHLSPDSIELGAFGGSLVPSQTQSGVNYRLEYVIGEGTASVAFFGMRVGPEGETPVVLKVTRPSFLSRMGEAAMMMIRKEAVALGRLNERVPATPFVVRLLDSGSVPVPTRRGDFEVPWNAVEYVHGGVEHGCTSSASTDSLQSFRLRLRSEASGSFRALRVGGLEAIHAVNVVHRDISLATCCAVAPTPTRCSRSRTLASRALSVWGRRLAKNTAARNSRISGPEQLFHGNLKSAPGPMSSALLSWCTWRSPGRLFQIKRPGGGDHREPRTRASAG
ncbi:MAG: hypothetical protein R3B07_09745 [Polyangiaceae bacterium]